MGEMLANSYVFLAALQNQVKKLQLNFFKLNTSAAGLQNLKESVISRWAAKWFIMWLNNILYNKKVP